MSNLAAPAQESQGMEPREETAEESWISAKQHLHADFVSNPLMCALQRLGGHFTPLCLEEGVSAVRVDVQLPELGRFDLVAKFWDESRTQECLDQVFAAARATDVVDSQWINTELTQMRISGHGVVSLSAYAGVCLDNAEQPELQTDDGLRQFMASVMMALRDLENVPEAFGGHHLYRDIKTSNITWDTKTSRFMLIDCGLLMPAAGGCNAFMGISKDHMAIELTDQVTVTLPSGQRMCSFRLWSNPHALAAIGPKYDNYMAGLTGLKVFLGGMPEAIDLIGPRYHVSPLSYQCQEQYQEARQDAEGRYLSAFRSFMSDLPGLGHLLSQRGLSEGGVDFLMWLLEPQPCDRPSAQLALQHKWLAPAVQQLQQEVQGSQQ